MYQSQTTPQQSMRQPGIANSSTPVPPQIPPGWAAHWDQSQQKFYFHNSMTGTVTWDYPWQNSLLTSPPGNVDYPPQQQQMQGFDPSTTPAPQHQQQHQRPANIPADPTAVGQPQPQHQQRQRQYGGDEYGGERYSGKEYGGEEYCGEGYGEYAGGGGFYGGGGFGGMLGGGGDDPVMTGIVNGSSYIYDPHMTGIFNAGSYIYDPHTTTSHMMDMMASQMMTSLLNAQILSNGYRTAGIIHAGEFIR